MDERAVDQIVVNTVTPNTRWLGSDLTRGATDQDINTSHDAMVAYFGRALPPIEFATRGDFDTAYALPTSPNVFFDGRTVKIADASFEVDRNHATDVLVPTGGGDAYIGPIATPAAATLYRGNTYNAGVDIAAVVTATPVVTGGWFITAVSGVADSDIYWKEISGAWVLQGGFTGTPEQLLNSVVPVGTLANVTGYATAGDSIEYKMIVEAANNGGGARQFVNDPGKWARITRHGEFHLEMFGAIDGATPAQTSSAIQSAIDFFGGRSTGTHNGGMITVGPRTYVMDATNFQNQNAIIFQGSGYDSAFKWDGAAGEDMFNVQDSSRSAFRDLRMLGNAANPPRSAIHWESPVVTTLATNEFMEVCNVNIGGGARGIDADSLLEYGILCDGAFNGNNDSYRVFNTLISNCTTTGFEVSNNQSIWGIIEDVIFDTCGKGMSAGSSFTGRNVGFNRNSVLDLEVYRDLEVNITGFFSENAVLPILAAQGVHLTINGGRILMTDSGVTPGDYWINATGAGDVNLSNLRVFAAGAADPRLLYSPANSHSLLKVADSCNIVNLNKTRAGSNVLGRRADIAIETGHLDGRRFVGVSQGLTTVGALVVAAGGQSALVAQTTNTDYAGEAALVNFETSIGDTIISAGSWAANSIGLRLNNLTAAPFTTAVSEYNHVPARFFAEREVTQTLTMTTLAAGLHETVTGGSMPGVKPGDFIAVGFKTGNQVNRLISGYVSADDTIEIVAKNVSAGLSGGAATETHLVKLDPKYGRRLHQPLAGAVYTDGTVTTLTVTDATTIVGDYVHASINVSQQGLVVFSHVNVDGTINVVIYNGTGADVTLADTTLNILTMAWT